MTRTTTQAKTRSNSHAKPGARMARPAKASKPAKTSKTAKTVKATRPAKPAAAPKDAIDLLRADHKAVNAMFADYEKAPTVNNRRYLVDEICNALSLHAQIEEELFYPAVKRALKDHELVPEATVEHAGMRDLIAQIRGVDPDSEMFDARVKVLSEYVKHHVKEEQDEMFPRIAATPLDLVELGVQMAARRAQLLGLVL